MPLDPLSSIFISYISNKAFDKVFAGLEGSELSQNLRKAASDWEKTLPKEIKIEPEVFFPKPGHDKNDQESSPYRDKLFQNLEAHEIPKKQLWFKALQEYREDRRTALKDQAHIFFKSNNTVTDKHLEDLADKFYDACILTESFFKKTVITALESINGIKDIDKNCSTILTIGSGNSEDILCLPPSSKIEIGSKHKVETEEHLGGSGVNYSMRLLSCGYDVFPILSIGYDSIGKHIKKELLKTARSNEASSHVIEFIGETDDEKFYDPNIQTPSTTIVVENSRRTIFTKKIKDGVNFIKHVEKRLGYLKELIPKDPYIVMIGHIHSDSIEISKENAGNTTKYIINSLKDRSIIFTNFGNSQLSLGLEFWKDSLPDIDFFQVNLDEAKLFFRDKDEHEQKLPEIIEQIRELEINAVITLDKFGAIGIHKEEKDCIYIAWPVLYSSEVKDPTGSGDAFAAGIVAHLVHSRDKSPNTFRSALSQAKIWAAFACGTYGGASDCPTSKSLEKYKDTILLRSDKTVEIRNQNFASEILTLLDIAFQPGKGCN
nr:carbohydrate kinase family protein [uncultured Desulfobacter sp.]